MRTPAPARSRAVLSLALAALTLSAAAPATRAAAQPSHAADTPAAPAATSATSAWAGVYRVSLTRGSEVVPARVLLEWVDGALYGTFLMDNVASGLARVRADDAEVRAAILTAEGRGELVLRQAGAAAGAGVVGTLTIGKATWEVRGGRSV